MSIYKREGSPYWYYGFQINGLRFRGSTEKTTKREAQEVESRLIREAKAGRSVSDDWRLRELFGAYWTDHGQSAKSADFIENKLSILSRILGPDTPLSALDNAKLLKYRAVRRGEGIQLQTINRDFNILRAAMNHARDMHGKTIPNIAWKKVRSTEPPGRVRFLNASEYETLVSNCDPELQRLVKFAVATGLRKTNILQLDWREVDLSTSLITIIVKGGKRHTVRMTNEIRAMLSTSNSRKGLVFDITNFRRRWESALKKSGLDDFRFHDLRHTFASWARMSGADLADICDALGHSAVGVTMRYAHIEPAHHETAFDRVTQKVWASEVSQSVTQSATRKG